MRTIHQNKIVIFGAGKIGRSFIGQLFSRGGYEVVFVDVYQDLIRELNARKSYEVVIKSDQEESLTIRNVRGVEASDVESVAHEVATAGIIAVCVGINGLPTVFPLLAKGLSQRYSDNQDAPLDVIMAENMRNADLFFRRELKELLHPDYPFDRLVGLIETSIGKMVPIMLKKDIDEDILRVFAEPYNTLILDKKGFRNPIPSIDGLSPKDNMKAWVDRKSFIHNLGHASAAYLGYLMNSDFVYMHEALAVPSLYQFVRETMLQSADILMMKYPGEFTPADLTSHIDDLLTRFRNHALGDTLFRVGCDLQRKMGPEDRMAGAIRSAIAFNLPYDKILFSMVCGFHFQATGENGCLLPEDAEFIRRYGDDPKKILSAVSGFDPLLYPKLYQEALAIDHQLKTSGFPLHKKK